MSRGQLARTPANFPRMKHRARYRRARRARTRAYTIDALIELRNAWRVRPVPRTDPDAPWLEWSSGEEEGRPAAAPMVVEIAERQRQDDIHQRSTDLARQRGHLRAYGY